MTRPALFDGHDVAISTYQDGRAEYVSALGDRLDEVGAGPVKVGGGEVR